MAVDFDVHEATALAVYRALGGASSSVSADGKSKIAAGLFALLLG